MSMMRNILIGEDVYFDTLKREIVTAEESVILGGREAAILHMLCLSPNQVVEKEEINNTVWKGIIVGETSLTKAISNLRKSLKSVPGVKCEIQTVPKTGYMLIVDDVDKFNSSPMTLPEASANLTSSPEIKNTPIRKKRFYEKLFSR
ncbi:winged helix-turn-helix domain-containing protein [Vibrio aestuarianus]|nr:winged helix-turn-helix domain-containing protein [Vibrio aestuarianus]MDE1214694.1 winged helix-turn-helix domain-containing protein [Vibrio aestuarianus]MDE1218815.1 winged helix-turn-helix domain-containing protein [Vibrio aestuarianus]MDE1229848.1 winged helix-turn-helix domain-containing protein [Vibrio aestuarianus]MDE1258240.1 winged helix-turn-helix domain-containing protein [Vibrio aestuarianus]MDE1261811.1 winged helix-turn-helix domain-containing protein [Vibrio aestuarianus]